MAEVDVWLEPVAKNEGEAVELLQQLFELDESQARELVSTAPCMVRNNVPDHLAKLVAKALGERGIEVKLVPALLTSSIRAQSETQRIEAPEGEPAEEGWDDGSVDTPLTGPEGSLASKRAPPLSAKEAAKRRAAMDKEAGRPARKKAAKASAPGGSGVLVAVALVAVVVSIGSLVWWATDSPPPPPPPAAPLSAAETDRFARQLLRREDKANASDWFAGGGELCRLDPSVSHRLVERLQTAGAESVDVAGYIGIADSRQMQNVIVTVGSADAAALARVARETVGREEADDGPPRATVEQGREYVVVKLSRY